MPRVTIAGLGLIGGSIGIALRKRGWLVWFVDPHVDEQRAIAAGAADRKIDDLLGDLVVIATPVDVAMRLESHGHLTTTTCRVMVPFASHVAGHPFAGSEKRGLENASGDLFAGRPWFVDRDVAEVRAMIEATGARQVVVDPRVHDEAMALTSHLPQVISTALASLIEQKKIDPIYLGSGLRTLLRLAESSYDVWRPILEANAYNVRDAAQELARIMNALTKEDFDRARRFITSAAPPER